MVQTYVRGTICEVPLPTESQLLSLLIKGADKPLELASICSHKNFNWLAYQKFDQLSEHYTEHKNALTEINTHISGWLDSHQSMQTLIHGDFWLGNILFDNKRENIIGAIDWDRHTDGGSILHQGNT